MIYFIRAGTDGPVKIGFTLDAEARLRYFQTSHYLTLHIIRVIPGTRAGEKWLHRHFRDIKIRGEWFHFDSEMLGIEVGAVLGRHTNRIPVLAGQPIPEHKGFSIPHPRPPRPPVGPLKKYALPPVPKPDWRSAWELAKAARQERH